MTVRVYPAVTRSEVRAFVGFPWSLYSRRDYPQWVAPLRASVSDAIDTKKNPFYQEAERALFLAKRGETIVGRIAAIENRAHTRHHGDRTGFFGFFECIDDLEVASALFDAASAWLAARGLDTMRGPMNPSTNYECGLMVSGFDEPPTFMTAWNPAYYDSLCRGAGLSPAKDLLGFWFQVRHTEDALPPFVKRLADRARRNDAVTFRDLDPSRFATEVEALWDIYNDAWDANWGFVPLGRDEFLHMAKDLRQLLDPRFAFMAECGGRPAGFMLAIPDYNEVLASNPSGRLFPTGALRMLWGKRRIRTMRVMALGVKHEFRTRSILALFTHEIMRRGKLFNKRGAEASWLLEDNQLIVKPMRDMGAVESRRWRLYDRPIEQAG